MTRPSLVSRAAGSSAWGFLVGLSWFVRGWSIPGSVMVLTSAEETPELGLPGSPPKSTISKQAKTTGTGEPKPSAAPRQQLQAPRHNTPPKSHLHDKPEKFLPLWPLLESHRSGGQEALANLQPPPGRGYLLAPAEVERYISLSFSLFLTPPPSPFFPPDEFLKCHPLPSASLLVV